MVEPEGTRGEAAGRKAARARARTKKSILRSWITSYALLFVVVVAISSVGYVVANSTIEYEVMRVNNELLKQLQQGLDSIFVEVSGFARFIGSDSRLESLMGRADDLAATEHYAIIKLIQDTSAYRLTGSHIADYYVYLTKSDTVLSTDGLLDARTFYAYTGTRYDYPQGLSYDEWCRIVRREYDGEYLAYTEPGAGGDVTAKIVYASSFPTYRAGPAEATIMLLLDQRRLAATIGSYFTSTDHVYLVLDESGNVIFKSPSHQPAPGGAVGAAIRDPGESFDALALTDGDGVTYRTVGGQRMAVSHIRSRTTDWDYILLVPEGQLWGKASYFGKVIVVMIALCLVLGVGLTFYFSRRNYFPVRDLVMSLERQAGVQLDGSSEYAFIKEVMERTLTENRSITGRLEVQEKVLRAHFFRRLLLGEIGGEDHVEQTLRRYGVVFPSDCFAVLLFGVTVVSAAEDDHYALARPLVVAMVEELANAHNAAVVSELGGMLACIVGLREEAIPTWRQELLGIVASARELLESRLGIELHAAVGGPHRTPAGICQSYREAMDVAQYRAITGNASVTCYDELAGRSGSYRYTIGMEYQLINHLKSGDSQGTTALLHDIFDGNAARASASPELAKCFMVDLVCTMLKAAHEIEGLHGSAPVEGGRIEALLACRSIEEIRAGLEAVVKEVCDSVAEVKRHKGEALASRIIDYVGLAYNDVNLSVTRVADAFSYSPAYLIQVFRECVGEGLASYITRYRIRKAVEIMKAEPRITVSALARRVGYGNSNTFIRAFKKREGVTPGSVKAVDGVGRGARPEAGP